ncbi:MAG TPA: NAD(P)-dependent oxidoreductase [Steroidobacteraceae bacterium]|nr:NAD(P)-dependent oxidoreductase [Steroidobacteraceae bacterium]
MRVGFIGLGNMGSGMAANLLRAGHELTVFNRSPEKRRPLIELGARAAETVAEACGGEVVITMLADDGALRRVALAEDGIVDKLRRGATHISMSTVSVELVRDLTQAHQQAGQQFVAAPVFGRPEMAAAAKLFIVVAGAPAAVTICLPLFDAIGQRTFPFGTEPAAASLVKLAGNFMIAATIETLGEALALLSKGGIEPGRFVDLLTATLFPAPAYRTYGALIAASRFQPAGFAAPLGHKDVRLLLAVAESLRVPMPIGSLLNDRFLRLLAQGGESLDWSAISQLAAADAGLPRISRS